MLTSTINGLIKILSYILSDKIIPLNQNDNVSYHRPRGHVPAGRQLLVFVSPLNLRLDPVVEEEVEAPGGPRPRQVGADAGIQAADSVGTNWENYLILQNNIL